MKAKNVTSKNIKPLTSADKLLDNLIGTSHWTSRQLTDYREYFNSKFGEKLDGGYGQR